MKLWALLAKEYIYTCRDEILHAAQILTNGWILGNPTH
jgi:hypothetical protein